MTGCFSLFLYLVCATLDSSDELQLQFEKGDTEAKSSARCAVAFVQFSESPPRARAPYLFGEWIIWVWWHPSGNVENHFHSRGSIVGGGLSCAAIALEATHEPTVRREVHLRQVTKRKENQG